MTPSDFARIEQNLGITLPASYRAFLAAYPSEADEDIRSHALFASPDRVIEENISHRKDGWFRIPWPHHYFVVGDDGCGDTYFMVLGKDERIYLADHEAGPHPMDDIDDCYVSESLQQHMEDQLEIARESERRAREKAARRANRKWWEFRN